MDYTKFNDFEMNKLRRNKFLLLQPNETITLRFKGAKQMKMINSFSGEEEDTIQYKFYDEEYEMEKTWNASSLNIFRQFKEQQIQEEDLVAITKQVEGKKTRYVINKIDK